MTNGQPTDNAPAQQSMASAPATKMTSVPKSWVCAFVLVLITLLAYQPVWHAGFIWDDGPLITDSAMIQARNGLYRIWFTTEASEYNPLTSSFRWLQWRLWGRNAGGYHAVNVLLHAANVLLIWMVLRRLKIPGAWLAAVLFTVHPVNVATVAWISEQKNTLSMLFFALSILWYVRFDEESQGYWYGLSLAAFLLALLSKTAVVMLPVVLLGCVWWLRGRVRRQDLLRSVPFFVLSLVMGLVAIWFEYNRDLGGHATRTDNFLSHLAVAGLVPWFYLHKAILPLDLCMVYPQWNPRAWGWSGWLPGIALAGSFALLLWKRNGWSRPLLFGFGYFVVMLFPVLGFFDQGFYQYSMVADHWQYYSIVGVTALAAAGTVELGTRRHREQQVIGLVAGVVVIALGALSWQRCLVFRTEETLFRDNLLYNPLAWVAHYNLGNIFVQEGRVDEAIGHYEQALRLKPDYAEAHCNLGVALEQAGRIPEAIEHLQQALRIKPGYAEVNNNLGMALAQVGRGEEAIEHYEQALRLKPDYAKAHCNLGLALAREGKTQEAMEHYEQALQVKPDLAEAHYNLGVALIGLGRLPEAMGHWELALRSKPDYAEAENNLAWLLATLAPADGGDPVRAVTLAEWACELTNNRVAEYLDTLAAAYAAASRFNDAIAAAQKAIELARSAGQTRMASEIETRLELYRAGRPYREPATVTSPHGP